MKREFCDRCDHEIRQGRALTALELPAAFAGDARINVELCRDCLRQLREFVKPLAKAQPSSAERT